MSKELIDEFFILLRVIAGSYSEKELSDFTIEKIKEFKLLYNKMSKLNINYFRELQHLSEQCDWDLKQFITEILQYPVITPRVRKLNGELHYKFENLIVDSLDADDLIILDTFYNEVRDNFLKNELFEEWLEFESLFSKHKNFLAAHAYANEVASKKGFNINKDIDEEFWRTVW